ncbi:hypothetical protein ACTWPB_07525 [Nocardia sp. IBHARD005]|uniref:hypothetical protein n=1 Tax=Nocardia sp. IBHARD005 TaxID=3457765 RepID=UPI004059E659
MTPEQILAEAIEVIARADFAHIEMVTACKHQRKPRRWEDAPEADRVFHRELAAVAAEAIDRAGLLPVAVETAVSLDDAGDRRTRYVTAWRPQVVTE